MPLLSLLLFTPFMGSLVLSLLPKTKIKLLQYLALIFQLVALCLGLFAAFLFNNIETSYQFVEKFIWIDSLGAAYHLGVDGISLTLILLVLFIFPIATFGSLNKNKWLLINCLFLESCLLGVFLAIDILLFYVFWEVVLIPIYFIILLWGGKEKVSASLWFFIYTMAASLFMLLAILILSLIAKHQLGEWNFDIQMWQKLNLGYIKKYFFWAFTISFAVKIPLVPFHSWLPITYKNAPWIGTIFMSALLSKMGIYGFLRIVIPLFPAEAQHFAPILLFFACVSILYAACIAMIQKDLKMVLAYSSISHLGLIVVGLFSFQKIAWDGAILQIINHSLITSSLFLILSFLDKRFQSSNINNFSGLAKLTPKICIFFFIFSLASIGFPGLNGFIGEFSILIGTFKSTNFFAMLAALGSALGMILSAVYMLRINQAIFFGKSQNTTKDLNYKELVTVLPSIIFIFWIGIYPNFFLEWFKISVSQILILLK